jgi:glycosyltransferase involved in cell wall biosynthesis
MEGILTEPQQQIEHEPSSSPKPQCEVSVVMPCLNEADTLATCIQKAREGLEQAGLSGEIIVADNGSTDGCPEIARQNGARVVDVKEKGYGHALMGGINAADGKYVIMGDADDSYDFREIPKFVVKLREGYELVQGCRLPRGGGRIMPGAMPFLHRVLGNPLLTLLARWWFWVPIRDIYCGMRGFAKALFLRLDQRCTGMEFATEMIIKANLFHAHITEVPITLYPDGRKAHPPHLRTFRDGWRTLRFFLLYCPKWLYFMPGMFLIMLGLMGYAVALPGLRIGGIAFDAHTLLFASLAILMGYQSVLFAIFTKMVAVSEGLVPEDKRLIRLSRIIPLERGLLIGVASMIAGAALLLGAINEWRLAHFGALDYSHTMRWVIPGMLLTALGFQTILASFFVTILRVGRK